MKINTNLLSSVFNIALEGRLDTQTAPELEKVVNELPAEAQQIVLDLAKLEYTSSAGLRVILKAQKLMSSKNGMILRNVNEEIMEVFDITGFSDILTIEE